MCLYFFSSTLFLINFSLFSINFSLFKKKNMFFQKKHYYIDTDGWNHQHFQLQSSNGVNKLTSAIAKAKLQVVFYMFCVFCIFCIFAYKHAKFWDSIIVVAILVHNPILTPPKPPTLTPLTNLYLGAQSRLQNWTRYKISQYLLLSIYLLSSIYLKLIIQSKLSR